MMPIDGRDTLPDDDDDFYLCFDKDIDPDDMPNGGCVADIDWHGVDDKCQYHTNDRLIPGMAVERDRLLGHVYVTGHCSGVHHYVECVRLPYRHLHLLRGQLVRRNPERQARFRGPYSH
jgi:hypothetical protein